MTKHLMPSVGLGDEFYTPKHIITPIVPLVELFEQYLQRPPTIWCPFDLAEDIEPNPFVFDMLPEKMYKSNFVQVFEDNGYDVIASHIATGHDFFEYEPPQYDIMISNPPFANKRKFFERAVSLNKPFALLNTVLWLNDPTATYATFKDMQLQMLFPDKRCDFITPEGMEHTIKSKRVSFKSAYYCRDFLQGSDIQWMAWDNVDG